MVTTEASKTAEDTCEHMDSWAHLMGRKMSHSPANKQLLMQPSRAKSQVLLQAPGTNCTRDGSHSTNGETVPELLRNGVPCDVAKVGLKCGISTPGLSILTKKPLSLKVTKERFLVCARSPVGVVLTPPCRSTAEPRRPHYQPAGG